ncbi:glycosyltransferase [Microbacterium sp. Marseille-Q6965]|uniref:glycosyltransferase n=1 Tax=Microbacterium sp. Marseille-Q6965 TaxID=2965072 RepID=UPI0021B7CFBD|nr:glycosyltransferase family 4 protein [Microbacterium sp. Marseille-Q6965]
MASMTPLSSATSPLGGTPAARAHGSDDELRHNDAVMHAALRIAERRLASGRAVTAMEWCRVAMTFAMTNPTGRLRSARFERVADRIAQRALAPSAPVAPRAGGRRRVLHVLTEAASIGGLSKLAERWIRRDTASRSDVVVVRQDDVTAGLREACAAVGGTARALGAGDPLARAARLRELAGGVDMVVCHLQPDDPVSAVAFGSGYAGAPVIVFDHADHLMLAAPTRATTIAEFRAAGAALTRRLRGYDDDAVVRLPLLVPAVPDVRPATREELGMAPGTVVAMTVARAVKFGDTRMRPSFGELIAAALEAEPSLAFCAIGPGEDDGPFPWLRRRFPGRVRALGPVTDPAPYLRAADLYLDTFPFSSLTSLLEACGAGLPAVTLDAHEGHARALGIADFVVDERDRPRDPDALVARIAQLVRDAGERAEASVRARRAADALAAEEEWLAWLEVAYAATAERAARGARLTDAPPPKPDDDARAYGRALLAIEANAPLLWRIQEALPRFDRRDRRALRARAVLVRVLRKIAAVAGASPRPLDRILLPGQRLATGGHR